jgi:phage shock protein PspC (stress-responsive transcriptional regulator)
MKKNITINIKGLVFHIDEDAYEKLNQYLNEVKHYFSHQDGASEIIDDIEARISELLAEHLDNQKQVVTIKDVNHVIKIMGTTAEMQEGKNAEEEAFQQKRAKRLFRDPENKILGGVAGGMAAYFNIDALWFRLAFVLLSFFALGPLAYIVFWVAVPMARTTAEKLEMKGEKVNIDTIERSVKEELRDLGQSLNSYANMAMRSFDKNKSSFKKTGNVAADGLMDILRFALKVAGVIAGFFLLFTALSLVTVIMAGLFFPEVTHFLIEDLPLTFHAPAFAEMFFSGGLDFTLLVLGLVVVVGLPLLALVTLSIRLDIRTSYPDRHQRKHCLADMVCCPLYYRCRCAFYC